MTSATNTPLHAAGGKLGKVAGRSNSGKSILHTIDPKFIFGIGQISEFGSRKYHMRNFLMAPGMEWSAVYDSMLRHLLLWWSGEEFDLGPNGEHGETDDPETNMKWSGLPHILHAAWNVMVLFTYENHGVYADGDDRPSKTEQSGVRWQDWKDDFDEARGLKETDDRAAFEAAAPMPPVFMKDGIRAAMVAGNAKPWGYADQAKQVVDYAIRDGNYIDVITVGDKTTITIDYSKDKT